MDEDINDIDNLFQKAVQRHEELPTGDVWEHLENNLQKRNVTSITKRYRKWKWVAAALFIVSMGLGMYTLHLSWKYKRDIKGNKLNTSNLNGRNSTYYKTDSSGHTSNKKAAYNSIAGETGIQNKLAESNKQSNLANDNKRAANEKPISAIATLKKEQDNINKDKRHKIVTGFSEYDAAHNFPVKENKRNKVLGKPVTNNKRKVKDVKEAANQTDGEISNKNNSKSQNETGFTLSDKATSSALSGSSAIAPDNENIDLKISLIGAPLNVPMVKPTVMPMSISTNSQLLHISTAKSGIKLKARSAHHSKFMAGIFYSEHKISTKLEANHPDYREDNYQTIKSHEKNRVSTTIGLALTGNIIGNLGITSGISLTTYTTDIYNKALVARRDDNGKINYRISTSSGYAYYTVKARPQPVPADSIPTLSSKSTIKYISVPLGLQYNFYAGRFGLTPALLVYANFKSTGKITTIQSVEHTYTGDIIGLKSHYFDGNIGLGIGYYINKTIEISLIPSARFALSTATEKNPVSTKRNSVGVAAGLNVAF